MLRDVAQLGSALDWGSRGRWFESSRPDHRSLKPDLRVWLFYYLDGTRLSRLSDRLGGLDESLHVFVYFGYERLDRFRGARCRRPMR